MKSRYFVIMLILTMIFNVQQSAAACFGQSSWTVAPNEYQVDGSSYTSTTAAAAASDLCATWGAYCVLSGSPDFTSWGWDAEIWGNYRVAYQPGGPGTPHTSHIFMYKLEGWDAICSDADSDGIINSLDPFPDNAESFDWYEISSCFNASNEKVWSYVKTVRGTTIDYFSVGVHNDCTTMDMVHVPANKKTSTIWAAAFESGGSYEGLPLAAGDQVYTIEYAGGAGGSASADVDASAGTETGMSTANDNTGNTVDQDFYSDIVANTKASVDNQQIMTDYLRSINKRLEDLKGLTSMGLGSETSMEYPEGITQDDVENAVDSAFQSEAARQDAETTSGLAGMPGSYDYSDDMSVTPSDDVMSGINQQLVDADSDGVVDSIESIVSGATGSNNLMAALAGSSIQITSSDCHVPLELGALGTHDLNFCTFESQLDFIGGWTVKLAYLIFFIIIFI